MARASSSPFPPPRSWTYHVFLSFRGQDTRKGFTDHLYASLQRKGITTFRDDMNLERGEDISHELLRAIEESMFAVVVLSPNYASSAWCLDELQKIVECKNNLGLQIVPVFYGVDPCDVRHQKGTFEDAFRKHEGRFGGDSEKVKRWRDALIQVASYSGWDSKNQHEATLVESIAQHVHIRLIPRLPSCIENLFGIASRVEDVTRLMCIGLSDVRFTGIWGMGGVGKTTIARAIYEAIEDQFQISCFLANIRETCETNGILQLQKLLGEHIHVSRCTFSNLYDGMRTIRNSLCNKKVLIVLDDVNDVSQLENLAGNQDWFGPGSRVMITTRDMHLLKTHEVCDTYEVECLDKREALRFFCSKAFKRDVPEEGYLEMSHEVVKYTGGLPLALKVLGSYLYGRNVSAWHSAVKKLRSVPDAKILETLRISYDSLDSMQMEIFLDIACFFKGKPKDKVLDLFEKRGYNPQIEIDVLIERSLVTVKQDIDVFKKKFDVLEMHDLLQEMGRNFVIQESPNYPSKRSRLWSPEDLDLMLAQNKGTETIQSIVLPQIGNGTYYVQRWRDKAIPNMSQLKFLNFDFVRAHIHINIPSTLKVLHWELCPLETLPLVDQRYELVEIKISWSRIVQLWHGFKFLEKLKHLDLSCSGLEQTPDLSGVPILETLDLSWCYRLTLIHPSLICHKSLLVLNLWECTSLETFPGKLEMSSLKELNLCDCKSFMSPPEFGECMTKLSRLYFQDMTISELPISLGSLVGLSELDLRGCKKLTCLPDSIHELESLRILRASWCSSLCDLPHSVSVIPFLSILDLRDCCLTEESFPCDFGQFPSLTDLDLSGNPFVNLPISIHELPKLKCLSLNGCKRLRSLPELPSSIRELKAWCCDSLDTRSFNNLSKACSVFASTSQGPGEVLQMVIPGTNIPSWFVHRQESNCLLVPFPHHCHPSERLGIALCFLVRPSECRFSPSLCLAVGNGDRVITSSIPLWHHQGYHLCMFCMTNDCLSDQETRKAIHFELSFENINVEYPPEILSSAACWVHTDEVEHLNKGETERPNKKRQDVRREALRKWVYN